MRKLFPIAGYEFGMQIKRFAGWLIWLLVSVLIIWDCYPSTQNYLRLSALKTPAYFIARILGQPGLLLLFGLMFLVAGRVPLDRKNGMKELYMATSLSKAQYLLGKWAGNFLYLMFMMLLCMVTHALGYALLNGIPFRWADYWPPLLSGLLYIIMPSCFFMTTCAVFLPVAVDIRLCYLLVSALCVLNLFTFGSETDNPLFRLTSGVLSDQVYDNPLRPVPDAHLIMSSLLFLLGSPLTLATPGFLRPGVWREKA